MILSGAGEVVEPVMNWSTRDTNTLGCRWSKPLVAVPHHLVLG